MTKWSRRIKRKRWWPPCAPKGVPVAYIAFPGEQHGFRRAETLKRSLESELDFYARVFGFRLPGK
jgi:hypothetical protein